jgi:hypothetical protein
MSPSSFEGPDVYEASFPEGYFGSPDLDEGKYNLGYVVDSELAEGLGGEVVEDPEEIILWTPLEERTPEMETQEDLLSYHLARQRNAEVMREEGLPVPDVGVVEAEFDSGYATFLATPFLEHESYDQRPKVPGGDSRRNNPHMQDPYASQDKDNFEAKIDQALAGIDGEELVSEGRIVNAGSGSIDAHNKNWGLVDGDLVRLDIGEVPAEGAVWNDMPYSGPEEFYREEDVREAASEMLEGLEAEPEDPLPEEYRELM